METTVERGNYRVVLTDDTDEGNDGDFNPDDPEDYPHVRFYADEHDGEGWQGIEDGSFCTALSAHDSVELIMAAANVIANVLVPIMERGGSVKRAAEELSWIGADWFGCEPIKRNDRDALARQRKHMARLKFAFLDLPNSLFVKEVL